MWLYNTIFILNIIFICLGYIRKYEKLLYYSLITFFFLLSVIRWERGTDWEMYYNYFNLGNLENMKEISEQGFRYVNYFIYTLTQNYTVLLIILSSILYLEYITIYKYSIYPLISALFLYSLNLGNIFFVRQTVAGAIVVYSLNFALNRNKIKFIFCILVAALFHRTAIICFVIYPIINMKNIERKKLFLLMITLILLYFFKDKLILFLSEFLPKNYKMKILFYLENSKNNFGLNSFMVSKTKNFLNYLQKIMWVVLILYKFKEMNKNLQKIARIYFLGVVMYFTLFSLGPAMLRLTMYFEVVQIILFPSILSKLKNRDIKIIFFIFLIIYCYLRLNLSILSYKDAFIPYKSIIF